MNNKKLFYGLIAGIAVLVFITFFLILRNIGGGNSAQANLTMWGVFDGRTAFDKVIRDYEATNPGIKVEYVQIPFENYEKDLLNALATGSGPDIFMIHNTWLPKHGDKLSAMPIEIEDVDQVLLNSNTFRNEFVDVAYNDLVYNNSIYGLPLYVDTLALYYNRDMLNSAGITNPPKNWKDFNSQVELLTRYTSSGDIEQAGVALGTAYNINRSTDILTAFMLQNRVEMTNQDGAVSFSRSVQGQPASENALQYYTDFANPSVRTYTWNRNQHYSVDAFIEGKAAMMINYSHQADIIRARAPRLNFSVSGLPQTIENNPVNFANYWAVGVSSASPDANQSWLFLSYLASKEGISSYLSETKRPSARRDLIEIQKSDADLGVFAVQALTAKSWRQPDNVAVETIFAEMIDSVNLARSSIRDAIRNAEAKINVLVK